MTQGTKTTLGLLIVILSASAFFRFYRIDQLTYFQYDQARDALYTKRLVVDHKLRLIGPQASPGFFTGPAYYYLMAPFLAVSHLDPSGMDFGVAFFGVLTCGLLFVYLLNLTKNRHLAFLFSLLYAINPEIIWRSRFSWNPNITPFFLLLLLGGLTFLQHKKKVGWYFVAVGMGLLLQLHFVAAGLLPAVIGLALYFAIRQRVTIPLSAIVVFLLAISPYILIDIKYKLINIQAILNLAVNGQQNLIVGSSVIEKISSTLQTLFVTIPFQDTSLLLPVWLLTFTGGIYLFIKRKKESQDIYPLVLLLLSFLIIIALYKGNFFAYYLTFLYPLGFIFLCFGVSLLPRHKVVTVITTIVVVGITIFSSVPKYPNLYVQSADKRNLVDTANLIAQHIEDGEVYNLVGIRTGDRYDHNAVDYRYFLEIYFGKKSLDWDVLDYQNSTSLFVVDHLNSGNPLKSTIWEITLFNPKSIAGQWPTTNGTIVYKLVK